MLNNFLKPQRNRNENLQNLQQEMSQVLSEAHQLGRKSPNLNIKVNVSSNMSNNMEQPQAVFDVTPTTESMLQMVKSELDSIGKIKIKLK